MVDWEGPTWELVCAAAYGVVGGPPIRVLTGEGLAPPPPSLRPFPTLRDSWAAWRVEGEGELPLPGGAAGGDVICWIKRLDKE